MYILFVKILLMIKLKCTVGISYLQIHKIDLLLRVYLLQEEDGVNVIYVIVIISYFSIYYFI